MRASLYGFAIMLFPMALMGAQVVPQQPIASFEPLQNLAHEKCITKSMIKTAFKEAFSLICSMVAHQQKEDRDILKGWLRGPNSKGNIEKFVGQISDQLNSLHKAAVNNELTAPEINLNYIFSRLSDAQKILEQELEMLEHEQRFVSAKCIILASLLDRTDADVLCESGERLSAAVEEKISQGAGTLRARLRNCTIS